jgi:hypothetical protein
VKKYNQEYWKKEIAAAEKRMKKCHKAGEKIIDRFLDKRSEGSNNEDFRLNLFNTHITTLLAMLYGRIPKIDVSRRHADADDDQARVAGSIFQRLLEVDLEDQGADFASCIRAALQDRLLPGMGVARVRYDFKTENKPDPQTGQMVEELTEESVPVEYVHWRDFLYGFCRTWSECPWVGFKVHLDEDAMTERFGGKVAKAATYKQMKHTENADSDEKDPKQTAEVWEIWCKDSDHVYWFQDSQSKLLDKMEDPLQLDSFFPCPPPMIANPTTSLFIPKADFLISQDLYNEIDALQTRISMITKSVKVIGVYDGKEDAIKRMMTEGVENDLIPVDNWAMFGEKGGMKGSVDWFPVDMIVGTLGQLKELRDETIQLLYQVTGLSDIMRGASSGVRESATAQSLKAKFASIRIQALQDEFARFAGDIQTLKAEVMSKHFELKTIIQQSNILNSPNAEEAMEAVKLLKSPDYKWRVEIRPESIAMVDYAQLKSERTEYLTALSTYIQSAQAMIKAEPGMGMMLMELMKWGLAGFKGSAEIEGVVDRAMKEMKEKLKKEEQQPPQPSPEQEKAKLKAEADKNKMQMDLQKEMVKMNNEMKKMQMKFQTDLMALKSGMQAKIQEEAAQAHFNILEKKAEAQIKRSEPTQ